jgi:tetratricopeptide (TPR) repeat protein
MGNAVGKLVSIGVLTLLCMFQHRAFAGTSQQNQKTQQVESETKEQFVAALEAYRAHKYSAAQSQLESLIKSVPENFEITELLGLVYVAQGKQQQANHFLVKAVQLRPSVAEARTALATNFLSIHRLNEAEEQFKKVIELEPASYDANHNLGEFYIQTGKIADAIPFLTRAQEIDPNAYNNGYDLALALEQTGQLDEARQQVHRLIRVRDSAELHSLLGEIEEKSRNYLSSAKQYEQAARADPSEQNILNWGAELLLHQTFTPAIEVFKAGISRFPQSAQLHNGLGIAFYGTGQMDDAVRAFLGASDLSPSDPLPLTFLGKACDGASPELAAQIRSRLQNSIGRFSRNADLNYYLAVCLWRGNQAQSTSDVAGQIESLLKRAQALNPDYADAYFQLGNLYAEQHRLNDAIDQYERALKVNSNSANFHYRLGQALARVGKADRAQEEFAIFERLRKSETDVTNKEQNQIQQFVYTIHQSGPDQQ